MINELGYIDYTNPSIRNYYGIKQKLVDFLEEHNMKLFVNVDDGTVIVYDNYVDIVDYKLKNIEDKAYIKQLNGYKKYISNFLKKDVNLYLYSIMENKLKKL